MTSFTILMDESGDLGFDFSKDGTTKHILITFLVVKECRPIISLVKKVFKTLPKSSRKRNNDYLHAYYEKPITRKRLLSGLATKDIEIASMRMDKREVLVTGSPNELYSNMTVALINRLYTDGVLAIADEIKLIASRRNTSRYLNEAFSESIANRTQDVDFVVSIVAPGENKCLHAVDFVSWALWQKYEKGDETYSDIISDKIVKEYEMYQ